VTIRDIIKNEEKCWIYFNDGLSATEGRIKSDFVIKVYIQEKCWKLVNSYVKVSIADRRMTNRTRQNLKLKKMIDY
jgi:hypothetical protein